MRSRLRHSRERGGGREGGSEGERREVDWCSYSCCVCLMVGRSEQVD